MDAVAEWSRCRILAGLVTSSSPVPLKTRRVGCLWAQTRGRSVVGWSLGATEEPPCIRGRCMLNLSRLNVLLLAWYGRLERKYWLRCRLRQLTEIQNCFGPVNWRPRSCDLTSLDYFLWGYVKSLVYADKPQTLDHLEDNIRRVIADIRPHMFEKVIENWTSRLDYIRASRGSPMPEIIFKM
ncbi:uncharacterized protein TNCV_1335051 [Trichonephila clavipes]|nr:uncharacterized protein TNCV_1335051 [Trichonephila clavipes]